MKAHLFISDMPERDNQTLMALCGKEVPSAKFVFVFDQSFDQHCNINVLTTCRKCLQAELNQRYVYGLVSGQQLITGENGPSL